MARLMCIATHHKGGTIWIKQVIRSLAATLGLPWLGIWTEKRMRVVPDEGRAFLVHWNSRFPPALWARDDVAMLHLIRDPRDILLSGCFYHHHAGVKGEEFLHVPRADLGGRTYQQHLNGLAHYTDKLIFEMNNKHAETLADMRAWPWGDRRSFELTYEDLMTDGDATLFGEALAHLGLEGAELAAGRKAFIDNSLFGGLKAEAARKGRLATHIVSGGRLARWKSELPRAVGEAYAERFGDDLIALGYETGTDWVKDLPLNPPAPDWAAPRAVNG